MGDVQIISMTCPNCGAAIEIPKMKAKSFCMYCGKEVVVQGIDKNAEIKKKGDINSGFPFLVSKPMLHAILISAIGSNTYGPLDSFQNIKVVEVKKAVVPGYYLYCNGTLNYNYELGMDRDRQRVVKRGDDMVTVNEKYTEWFPQSAVVQEVKGFFTPANKSQADIVCRLFSKADAKKLVDVESLDFPAESIDYENDLPSTVAFGTYVKPAIEEILKKKATDALKDRKYRNVVMNGATIMKDQEVRVALCYYIIKLEYRDKEYTIYCNNDASQYYIPALPIDNDRMNAIKAKEAELNALKPNTGLLTTGLVISIIGTIISLLAIATGWAFILFLMFGGGIVVTAIFRSKKLKQYNEKRALVQGGLDCMLAAIPNAEAAFRAAKHPFKGYFEDLEGNPDAF